jgi:hypothetical protein
VTGRVLVTARCRTRGHTLAELLATPDGLQVHIPHTAVGHAKGSRVVNHRGGPLVAPLLDPDPELSMIWPAMCAEGVHSVCARDLARAASTGTKVITLDPVLR